MRIRLAGLLLRPLTVERPVKRPHRSTVIFRIEQPLLPLLHQLRLAHPAWSHDLDDASLWVFPGII